MRKCHIEFREYRMRFEARHIIIVFLCIWVSVQIVAQETIFPAIQQQEKILKRHPEDVRALKELCFLYLHKADYQKAIEYGEKLFKLGYEKRDYKFSALYAHIALGQAYLMLGDSTAINHLGQAMLIGESEKMILPCVLCITGWDCMPAIFIRTIILPCITFSKE